MKILVTGAEGQMGNELLKLSSAHASWDWRFLAREELDITDESEVKSVLENYNPDIIINTAAYTNVEKAETESETAFLVNEKGPKLLSLYAGNALLIHISTDFVFSGEKNIPYTEKELPHPINQYGFSKLAGEKAIQEHASRFFIIRTSWLYGTFQKNFFKSMLHLANVKPYLSVVDDQIGTPTYTGDLADVIIRMIKAENITNGIYHFSNEGVASWYDFAKAIFEYSGKEVRIIPVPATEFPSKVNRPRFSVMNKQKLKMTLDFEVPHWRESLQKAVNLLEKETN